MYIDMYIDMYIHMYIDMYRLKLIFFYNLIK